MKFGSECGVLLCLVFGGKLKLKPNIDNGFVFAVNELKARLQIVRET